MLKDVSDCVALLADQVGFRMSSFDEDRDAAYFHVGVAQYIVQYSYTTRDTPSTVTLSKGG